MGVDVRLGRPAGDGAVFLAEPVRVVLEACVELQVRRGDDMARRQLERQVRVPGAMAGAGLARAGRVDRGERVAARVIRHRRAHASRRPEMRLALLARERRPQPVQRRGCGEAQTRGIRRLERVHHVGPAQRTGEG